MNLLLERLPARERADLMAQCQPRPLTLERHFLRAGAATRHAWFPEVGFLSLLSPEGAAPALEVGLIGSEGMLGAELAIGVPTVPMDVLVQGAGEALRIDVAQFRRLLVQGPALRRLVNRYLHVRMQQVTGMSPCHRYHPIEARLARWLLMSHDRSGRADFPVTQEFLARMLGVRRSGVTLAAIGLQERGLVRYSRGRMQVLDRAGLERASCACYEADNATYRQGMAAPNRG